MTLSPQTGVSAQASALDVMSCVPTYIVRKLFITSSINLDGMRPKLYKYHRFYVLLTKYLSGLTFFFMEKRHSDYLVHFFKSNIRCRGFRKVVPLCEETKTERSVIYSLCNTSGTGICSFHRISNIVFSYNGTCFLHRPTHVENRIKNRRS